MSTLVQDRREHDYAGYLEYSRHEDHDAFAGIISRELGEKKSDIYELATDLAERLGYPVRHVITNEVRDGMVYGRYDRKNQPMLATLWEGIEDADQQYIGADRFEYQRRIAEYRHGLVVNQMVRGETDGNTLVTFSKIPDDVRLGRNTTAMYRPDLGRNFLRIDHYEDGNLNMHIISLDGVGESYLKKISEHLGIDVTDKISSEAILADIKHLNMGKLDVEWFIDGLIATSDDAIAGPSRHQGSLYTSKKDALTHVFGHKDVIKQYLDARGTAPADELLARAAAMIALRERGESAVLISDGGVAAEVESGNYDGYCPTIGAGKAATEALNSDMKCVKCPIPGCGKIVDAIMGEGFIACPACEKGYDKNGDLRNLRELRQSLTDRRKPTIVPSGRLKGKDTEAPSQIELFQARVGPEVSVSKRIGVMCAYLVAIDARGIEINREMA